jgi:hypothetical protein
MSAALAGLVGKSANTPNIVLAGLNLMKKAMPLQNATARQPTDNQ